MATVLQGKDTELGLQFYLACVYGRFRPLSKVTAEYLGQFWVELGAGVFPISMMASSVLMALSRYGRMAVIAS